LLENYKLSGSSLEALWELVAVAGIDTPIKMLGSITAQMGSNARAITQMKDKAEAWLAQAQAGKLHKQNIWFLMDKQFWPKVGYGIGTVAATFQELKGGLMHT
jgi:hypothetical protein